MTKPKIPSFKTLEPKYEGWRCVSQLSDLLNRAGRLPYLLHVYASAGGEGFAEFETLAEAQQAADALNYYEEYVASVYDASGERIYDCGGVETLINTEAPSGKFRVIADNFGKWAAKHDDILVGDFDTLEAARREAKLWHARPAHEHWSVTVFDDKGAIAQ